MYLRVVNDHVQRWWRKLLGLVRRDMNFHEFWRIQWWQFFDNGTSTSSLYGRKPPLICVRAPYSPFLHQKIQPPRSFFCSTGLPSQRFYNRKDWWRGHVRQYTSIPVPEVFESYIHPETGHPCIIMEYIEGKTLDEEWSAYSGEEKKKVIGQLRGYIGQLRSIEA